MECAFDLKPIFENEIVKVRSDLLPESYVGGPETYKDVKQKIGWIIDRIGVLSGIAQGLHTSVTSVPKMNSNQTIYLMAAPSLKDKARLVIVGLLKMGPKDLYLFDEHGQLRSRTGTPAVLDFFVHSSFQRRGLGKRLFDNMLTDLGLTLCKCAVDRPSAMMSAFLAKHYGLVRTIAQANKYVLYEGFFGNNEPAAAPTGSKANVKSTRSSCVKPTDRPEKELKVLSMAEILEAGKRHNRDNAKMSGRRNRE